MNKRFSAALGTISLSLFALSAVPMTATAAPKPTPTTSASPKVAPHIIDSQNVIDETSQLNVAEIVKDINTQNKWSGYHVGVLMSNTPNVNADSWEADTKTYVENTIHPSSLVTNGKLKKDMVLVTIFPKIRKIGVFAGSNVPNNEQITEDAYNAMKPDAANGEWNQAVEDGAKTFLDDLNTPTTTDGVNTDNTSSDSTPAPVSSVNSSRIVSFFTKAIMFMAGIGLLGFVGVFFLNGHQKKKEAMRAKESEEKAAARRAEEAEKRRREAEQERQRLLVTPVPDSNDVKKALNDLVKIEQKLNKKSKDHDLNREVSSYRAALAVVDSQGWTDAQRGDSNFRATVNSALKFADKKDNQKRIDFATGEGSSWQSDWSRQVSRLTMKVDDLSGERPKLRGLISDKQLDNFLDNIDAWQQKIKTTNSDVKKGAMTPYEGKLYMDSLDAEVTSYIQKTAKHIAKSRPVAMSSIPSDYRHLNSSSVNNDSFYQMLLWSSIMNNNASHASYGGGYNSSSNSSSNNRSSFGSFGGLSSGGFDSFSSGSFDSGSSGGGDFSGGGGGF